MTAPIRLQLSRKLGFDLQAASIAANGRPAINVARPTKWGNPFTIEQCLDSGFAHTKIDAQAMCAQCFQEWLAPRHGDSRDWWSGPESDRRRDWMLAHLPDLRGRNLACWCPPGSPCHADSLLILANGRDALP